MKYPTQEEIEEALAELELGEGETEFIPPSREQLEEDYRRDEQVRQ